MADDFTEQLNAVLGNPEAMGQIMSIARALTGDGNAAPPQAPPPQAPPPPPAEPEPLQAAPPALPPQAPQSAAPAEAILCPPWPIWTPGSSSWGCV